MNDRAYEAFMSLPIKSLSKFYMRVVNRRVFGGGDYLDRCKNFRFVPYGFENVRFDILSSKWERDSFGVDRFCEENRDLKGMLDDGATMSSVSYNFFSGVKDVLHNSFGIAEKVYSELKKKLRKRKNSYILIWADFGINERIGGRFTDLSFLISSSGPLCLTKFNSSNIMDFENSDDLIR